MKPYLCIPIVDVHTDHRTLKAGKIYVVKYVRSYLDGQSTVGIEVEVLNGTTIVSVAMDAFTSFFQVQKKREP